MNFSFFLSFANGRESPPKGWVFFLSFLLEFCPWVLVFSAGGVKKKPVLHSSVNLAFEIWSDKLILKRFSRTTMALDCSIRGVWYSGSTSTVSLGIVTFESQWAVPSYQCTRSRHSGVGSLVHLTTSHMTLAYFAALCLLMIARESRSGGLGETCAIKAHHALTSATQCSSLIFRCA